MIETQIDPRTYRAQELAHRARGEALANFLRALPRIVSSRRLGS